MVVKHYKLLSNLMAFLLGAFIFGEVLNYPFLFMDLSNNTIEFLIPQGFYVLGLLCIIACFASILQTIKKKGVFIKSNEKIFRYFGLAIIILGVTSDLLFNFMADYKSIEAHMLAFIGGTLVFVSLIFQVGIKLKEEQDLTI